MKVLNSTIVAFDVVHHTFRVMALDEFTLDGQEKNWIYWVHCNLNYPDDLNKITEKLSLPQHVIALCAEEDLFPKLIDDSDSLTIQTECLFNENKENEEVVFANLIFHLTSRYCFTATSKPSVALATFEKTYVKALKYAKTPCFILFLILDNVMNDFSRWLLHDELIVDQIDLKIRDQEEGNYQEVMAHKKQVMKIQHHIASIRDLLMHLSGRKMAVISEQCRLSLSKLLDHSQIIFNEANSIRDILNNTLDQIDNALMQKMNHTMRVLTGFAAIFLPLTLIAGIYGMNFHWIPELGWRYGYFYVLVLMFICAVVMVSIFKRNKWF